MRVSAFIFDIDIEIDVLIIMPYASLLRFNWFRAMMTTMPWDTKVSPLSRLNKDIAAAHSSVKMRPKSKKIIDISRRLQHDAWLSPFQKTLLELL